MDFKQFPTAGYSYFIQRYRLMVIPPQHQSYIGKDQKRSTIIDGPSVIEIFPSHLKPADSDIDQLIFALKYDGVDLCILSMVFHLISEEELEQRIIEQPYSGQLRRLWFLYEFLQKKQLAVVDLKRGNYIPLLDEKRYFVHPNGLRSKRHKIENNLLGTYDFCPMIRKSGSIKGIQDNDLFIQGNKVLAGYSPDFIRRALGYLYKKETKASFDIEQETPRASRIDRFIALLFSAHHKDFLNKDDLIDLQHHIVDPRFIEDDYRDAQNYVGQTISYQNEIIHYICPKPEDVPSLMKGLIDTHGRLLTVDIPAIIHAALISYGFVYLHPFEDGNGRIHRFLIHNILALRGCIDSEMILPVSAVMLNDLEAYDKSLESFSRRLGTLIDYELDVHGHMKVLNETGCFYRYMDLTHQTEALFHFVKETIEKEMVHELDFLKQYDQAKKGLQSIVDMPDRLIDLFINVCMQNHGKLSTRKRESHFAFLTDEEKDLLEAVISRSFSI